jgi:metallo-beta-lactamase family protein
VPKPPRLTFFGAAGEVTGSCTLLETDTARVLVDFGLFQGSPLQELRNATPPAAGFRALDAVVCTHAHVDHCGRLGMLPGLDYDGPVFCHEATAKLLPRVLKSSASLQAVRLEEYRNGTAPEAVVVEPVPDPAIAALARRTGDPPVLYHAGQAAKVSRALVGLPYGAWREIAPGVRLRLHDAAHIIGSASVELEVRHGARHVRVLFSGDLGPAESDLLAARGASAPADVVVMESTAGARRGGAGHAPAPGAAGDAPGADARFCTLSELVQEARQRPCTTVVPTFSVGRAQLIVHRLARLSRTGALAGLPVYLDSPMAARTAELCCEHPGLLSAEAAALIASGHSPLDFDELFLLWSRKQSVKVAARREAGIVLAGSGFCDAGPVLHHLARVLPDPEGLVAFTGHVMVGSLSHALAHGQARRVRINGQEMRVRASVRRVDGFSGHADAAGLEAWVLGSGHVPELLVLNHGDATARSALAETLQADIGSTIRQPAFQETVELA